MKLSKELYVGDIHQKIIVSEEKGRKHIAKNPDGSHEVRHYRLDDDLEKGSMCCDFLLIDDTKIIAYYIELKGRDIEHATKQLMPS